MFKRTENQSERSYTFLHLPRRGGAAKVVVVLLLIVGVVVGFFSWRWNSSKASKRENLIFATVERGTFIHEVTGKGSAESGKNVDVVSQVEGQATVIYLIPEGTDVKKGDLLVELDSSSVDEKLDSQVVTTNTSRATLNNSRATLRSAEISLEEYVEGTFEQSWMDYENTIFEAEQTRKQNADSARFTERLLNLNYSTELQYEIDKVAEEKAKNSLEVANLKKNTLLKYTSEKQITSLMSDIETARAKVDSDKNSYNINLNRENRYRQQSQNCKIKAPQDGQVVYANQDSRRMSEADMVKEGSSVRQRQVLVRLPDKNQMQVKTMINESNISAVKVGMPAKISFDSIPDRVIEGEVIKVNLYPEIVWMSSAKDYVTLVKINEDAEELRSGLTAQVRIIADEQNDVLMVPVHCVTEFGKKTYCLTYVNGQWGYKEVLLGASNEKQVIILDGLQEGEVVVSGARNYREKVTFPDASEPSIFVNSEIYQQRIAEEKATEEKIEKVEAGMPSGGKAPAMMAGLSEQMKAGNIPDSVLSQIPPEVLARFKGGPVGGMSTDELEDLHKRQEEAAVYAKTIESKLHHDSEIASIESFFDRTVMQMHRELLAAIEAKTSNLQARIALRQSEITRRQEDIELLQRIGSVEESADSVAVDGNEGGEDSKTKIERLTSEIQALRGDSEVPTLERVVYLDMIDWDKYVHGNDITREAIHFLSEESDSIFDQLFPNSREVDFVHVGSEDDSFGDASSDSDEDNTGGKDVDYSAFLPLFEVWDTNHDDRLKPTEFVIGFFSDRKCFQDSESDDEIERCFAEYDSELEDGSTKTNASELAMENIGLKAYEILCERAEEASSRIGRGFRGGPSGSRRGLLGVPLGEIQDKSSTEDKNAEDRGLEIKVPEPEPIRDLAEATTLRQAVALYVEQMDFNKDGMLQKSEFVKGYHEVKDVAGKLFTSAGSSDFGGGAPMGMGVGLP